MSSPGQPSYALVTTTDEFEAVCSKLIRDAKPFAWDIETSYDGDPREEAQLHPEENFPCGLSLTNALTWARSAALRFDNSEYNLDEERAAWAFYHVLMTGLGVAHGAKFEIRVMTRWFTEKIGHLLPDAPRCVHGFLTFPVRSCTMLESYAEADNLVHGLKDITWLNAHHKMLEITELWGKRTRREEKQMRFSELDPSDPKVVHYMCEDSLWSLWHHQRRYEKLKDFFIYQLEMAILPITCEMEDEGVRYDWNYMREGAQRAKTFKDRLALEVNNDLTTLVQQRDPAEQPIRINLGSWKQKSDVLYGKLGMTTRRKSRKTGNMSTDKVALKGLSMQYPVVKKMLNWSSLTKLHGTYLEVYEGDYSYAPDGRAHPSWLQHGVPAGRFAAAKPPVQQSPKKYHFELADGTVFDFNFRDAIVSPPGWYLIGFDYAQQEVRVLAGEAGETALVEAFAAGIDVHKFTASMMLGKPMEDITKDERDVGKTIGLALGYQMGVDGLADRLGITKPEAQALFDQYFGVFTRIKSYMERTIAGAKARGYIVTRFGRKVRIPDLESGERWKYMEGERTAGNAPIQGAGTGDYPKIAMVRSDKALRQAGLLDGVRMCMNMHDALYWYVRDDIPPAQVIRVLQPAVVFPVDGWPPIVAEWQAGRRWGSLSELELLGDGTVRVKTKDKPEVVAEVDGDPDEEPVAAAPVRWQPAAAARPASVAPAPAPVLVAGSPVLAEARPVIIRIPYMISQEQFGQLTQLIGAAAGYNPVTLVLPDGTVPLRDACGITPEFYQSRVEMLLPGAQVMWASVDNSALAAGLVLER